MRCLLVLAVLLGCSGCVSAVSPEDWVRFMDAARADGRMRPDRDPADAPVTARTLTESFQRVAFSFEDAPFGFNLPEANERLYMIRKWTKPIVYRIDGPPELRARVDSRVDGFMQKLSGITGHRLIRYEAGQDPTGQGPESNLGILYGDEDYFLYLARGLINAGPPVRNLLHRWRTAFSPCGGSVRRDAGADGQSETGEILSAIIVIRHELPEDLLESCIEEELAQSMGLFNDDEQVRPSMFNDDQEFALLTRHDELLLRILYDPRLRPGMPMVEAMPVVREIAAELVPAS